MDEKLQKVIDGFAGEIAALSGDGLESLVLYGSAVSGEYVPGRSDLNFLMVLKDADEAALSALIKPFKRWRKKGVGLPLIMDRADLTNSLDSFPMEFLEMKLAYKLISGRDVLSDLAIAPEHLRLQCEREVKGKLIQLRRGYLEFGEKSRDRDQLFRESIKSFLVIMRSMLWLERVDPVPVKGEEVIGAFEKKSGRRLPHCRKVLEFRAGRPKLAGPEAHSLFSGYLLEISGLAEWIDSWTAPGEPAQ